MLFSPRLLPSSLICYGVLMSIAFAEPKLTTHWQSDLATAQRHAKEINKPVLLHFYTDWCGPCKQMEATVFEAAEFKKVLGTDVVGVKINGDYHSDLVSRFSIKAYPADVLLAPDGKEIKRSLGRVSLDQYVSLIQQTAAPYQIAAKEKADTLEVKTALKVKRDTLGLKGYSPVALIVDSAWVKGDAQYQETYQGLTFYFANAEEKAKFSANRETYLPKYLECDPVALKESGRAVVGNIQYGAVYEGRIYFMSSKDHQKAFLASPEDYVELLYEVSLDATPEVVQAKADSTPAD